MAKYQEFLKLSAKDDGRETRDRAFSRAAGKTIATPPALWEFYDEWLYFPGILHISRFKMILPLAITAT